MASSRGRRVQAKRRAWREDGVDGGAGVGARAFPRRGERRDLVFDLLDVRRIAVIPALEDAREQRCDLARELVVLSRVAQREDVVRGPRQVHERVADDRVLRHDVLDERGLVVERVTRAHHVESNRRIAEGCRAPLDGLLFAVHFGQRCGQDVVALDETTSHLEHCAIEHSVELAEAARTIEDPIVLLGSSGLTLVPEHHDREESGERDGEDAARTHRLPSGTAGARVGTREGLEKAGDGVDVHGGDLLAELIAAHHDDGLLDGRRRAVVQVRGREVARRRLGTRNRKRSSGRLVTL